MDWKARFKNKTFLVTLFGAVLVLAQLIAEAFGYDITVFNERITLIFNQVLVVLTILGIVVNPTTSGVKDNEQ